MQNYTFTIYQPKELDFFAKATSFDKSKYNIVWQDTILDVPDVHYALESIFELFNTKHPNGFKGHSLSTGDVVYINKTYYICKNFGWGKLERVA